MWEQFISLVDGTKLTTLVVLIGVDFLAGIIVAVKERTFQFSKLANFLNTSILGFVGGYFLLGLVATVEASFTTVLTASWVALGLGLLGSIALKLKKLGLPIPDKGL